MKKILSLLVMVCCLMGIGMDLNAQCIQPVAGIVSWWQGEGNANDVFNLNNGSWNGTPTYVSGEVGQAFSINNSDYISVGSPSALQVQNFSIECWVQRASLSQVGQSGNYATFLGWGGGGWAFGLTPSSKIFLGRTGASEIDSTQTITDLNWHHVAVTVTNGAVYFYLDGVQYSAGSYSPGWTFSGSADIGSAGSGSQQFYGNIDEIAFYSNILTSAQVAAIYNAGSSGKCPDTQCYSPPASIVNWWRGENNANDAYGLDQGTAIGGTTYVSGEVGQAFSFDGSSGYLKTATSLTTPTTFSIEMWFNTTTTIDSPLMNFGSAQDGSGTTALFIQINASGHADGKIYFQYWNGSTTLSLNTPSAYNDGTWHHLVVTHNNGVGDVIYVDGTQQASYSNAATVDYSQTGYWIFGAGLVQISSGFSNGHFYQGYEDEITYYNTVLTSSQVTGLYSAGTAGKCADSGSILINGQLISSTNILDGDNLTFSVTNTTSAAYQWYYNGSPISGATSSTYTLTSITPLNDGTYYVTVSNSFGLYPLSSVSINVIGACYPCPAGITDWWPGNGNGADIIGGYNVTPNNGGEGYGAGVVGQAFTFTGVGNYYAAPSANWNFGTSDFTIEMWANFASTGGNQAFIACDNGGGSNNKWFFAYDIFGNGGLVFHNQIGSSVYDITAGTFVPTANTWYHIAVTRHVNTWTFYVNGSAIGSTSFSGAVAGVSANLTIGEGNPNDGFVFNGSLDEVSIYNNALSSSQISGIYNAGASGKCQLPVIIAQPQSKNASIGSTVNFNVSAIAYSSLQWLFNNVPLSNGGVVSGATSTNLTLTGISALNNGYYSLELSASGGSITSSVVALNEISCVPESPGIVAWYPGEGNANDTYGGYNGSFSGSYVVGEVGQAFNINSGSVSIPNNSWMYNLGSGNFTIELWAYFSNPNQSSEAIISCDVGGGSNPKWMFFYGYIQGGDDVNSLSMVSGNGGTTIGNAHFVPNAYQWYHIAVTYAASSGTYDFYANGILLQSVTSQPAIQNVNATMYFGQAEGEYNFTGYEDEVTFYTNTLSQAQIQAIYSAGEISKCNYFAPASSSKAPFYLMLQN